MSLFFSFLSVSAPKQLISSRFQFYLSYLNILYIFTITPHPDEMHSTCKGRGAYVHQVPL